MGFEFDRHSRRLWRCAAACPMRTRSMNSSAVIGSSPITGMGLLRSRSSSLNRRTYSVARAPWLRSKAITWPDERSAFSSAARAFPSWNAVASNGGNCSSSTILRTRSMRKSCDRAMCAPTAAAVHPSTSQLRFKASGGAPAMSSITAWIVISQRSAKTSARLPIRKLLARTAGGRLSLGLLTCQPQRRQRADHRAAIDRKDGSIRVDLLLGLVSQLTRQRGAGDALLRDIDLLGQPERDEDEDGAEEEGELIAKALPERSPDDRHHDGGQVRQRNPHRQARRQVLGSADLAQIGGRTDREEEEEVVAEIGQVEQPDVLRKRETEEDEQVQGIADRQHPLLAIAIDELADPTACLPVDDRGDDQQQSQSERVDRSEERRVGKECRSRWSPYH